MAMVGVEDERWGCVGVEEEGVFVFVFDVDGGPVAPCNVE